ncbi:MAG: NUDIX hydrolase [Balneolales bacterium]
MRNNQTTSYIKDPELRHRYSISAGGGVVFRLVNGKVEILLIHRRNLWDLPKGKLNSGESIAHCAAREVSEESGAELPMIVKKLTSTIHQYEEDGLEIEKITHWYAMLTRSKSFTPQKEEDIDEIRWVFLDEAIDLVGYDNLKIVLQKFKEAFINYSAM